MIVPNPLPFAAALWSRVAESAITAAFGALSYAGALLHEELNDRSNALDEDCCVPSCTIYRSSKLEDWRLHYDLVCRFVDMINGCFGPILLLQTAIGFAWPIFEFTQILYSKGQKPRFYFEFSHTILRFLFMILIPSYLVTQQVTIIILCSFFFKFHFKIYINRQKD